MHNYKLIIDYDGTDFKGWQRQSSVRSVQGDIEHAISTFLNTSIELIGCGRTDATVHGKNYVANFLTNKPLDIDQFRYKVNRILDRDVIIRSIEEVALDFHARFDALSRSYQYFIITEVDPFRDRYSYRSPYQLDRSMLDTCADLIRKSNDFMCFCKTGSDNTGYRCSIHHSFWSYEQLDNNLHLTFNIKANRFLRGMVRLLVGAQINVARGKISISSFQDALTNQNDMDINWSVPGKALFFMGAEY